MLYRDFTIRIVGKRDNGYDVIVDSPAGCEKSHLLLPFDLADILVELRKLGSTFRSGGTRDAEFLDSPTPVTPQDIGGQLYRALFSGAVGRLFDRSYGVLSDPEVGLRIKLHLNLDDPEVSALAQIPWEFLYEDNTRDFLSLSTQTPLVRYIEVPRAQSAYKLKGGLRVLVVIANPRGVAPLDLAKERALIEQSWARSPGVEVEVLEHPTKDLLLRRLVEKRFHVLHFMGHGTYDKASGAGALVLEDPEGNADLLDAPTLGAWLRDTPRLRLIFLNACDTARTHEHAPFAGIANRLVLAGVPAVVAMQFPVSDEAAISFSRTFYERLAAGFPVDEATAQGRKAILAGRGGTAEWGTPVLYMRAPDGQLFDMERPSAPPDDTAQQPAPQDPDAFRISASSSIAETAEVGSLPSPAAAPRTGTSPWALILAVLGALFLLTIIGGFLSETMETVPSVQSEQDSSVQQAESDPEWAARQREVAKAYLQAITGGAGSKAVAGVVDYVDLGCSPVTVWGEQECQAPVLDGLDGNTLFLDAVETNPGANDWRQSNLEELLPIGDLRRVASDPRYDEALQLLTALSTRGNGLYPHYDAGGSPKHLLQRYLQAVQLEVQVARAYIQAVSAGRGSTQAGDVDYRDLGCGPASVWDDDACQAKVLDDRDGKTVFMDLISEGFGDWQRSNVQSLLPAEDLQRVLSDPELADTLSLFESMSSADNDWYPEHAGPGGAKDTLRQYMDAHR